MKSNKKTIYSALTVVTALLAQLPATAQETADSAMVNVAFKKTQKSDVLGGVSTVDVRELTEKNYNTYSLDNMQGYVSGYNGNGMWGYSNALVLIDGVPREASNVTPAEIESISFLKGAQASVLYGSRAANGVIMITIHLDTPKLGKVPVRTIRTNIRSTQDGLGRTRLFPTLACCTEDVREVGRRTIGSLMIINIRIFILSQSIRSLS
jgi:TonB-dependent SusC/RagA subfamily outer membrane receptor